jgi:hypothetical protein
MVSNRNSGFSTGVSPNQKFFSIDAIAAPSLSTKTLSSVQSFEYKPPALDTYQGPMVQVNLPTNPIFTTPTASPAPLPNNSSVVPLYSPTRGSVDVSVPSPGSSTIETVINTPASPKNILPKVLLVLVIAGVGYYGYKMFFAKSKTN